MVKEGLITATATGTYSLRGWKDLTPVARRLMATRLLRSVAQGALAVDFTLYLHARHWSAPAIGLLLMAGGLVGSGLSLLIGVASDKVGRRLFLLIYEGGLVLGTVAVILAPTAWVLALAGSLFGFGRGGNGSSGPFAPAEQAWLAQSVPGPKRGEVFSLNAGLQFWGMGIGSLLAAFVPHMIPGEVGAQAFLPMFLLTLAVAFVNFLQIWPLKETADTTDKEDPVPGPSSRPTQEAQLTKRENKALGSLVIVNMVNSMGVGLIMPLLPYWFTIRFGVGPESIGPVYALTFFLTGVSSLVIGWLSNRIGLVRSIVLPRLLAVVLLIAIPFVPTFGLAAGLYVMRSIFNRGSAGARQAFGVNLVRDHRRGLASSLNAISWSLPAAIGPALGGWLIGLGALFWPFLIASGLQLLYAILFPSVMGRYESRTPTASDVRA